MANRGVHWRSSLTNCSYVITPPCDSDPQKVFRGYMLYTNPYEKYFLGPSDVSRAELRAQVITDAMCDEAVAVFNEVTRNPQGWPRIRELAQQFV